MTQEKRCNDCGWEFYNASEDEFEMKDGSFKWMDCCPECGSNDIDYKLVERSV